MKTYQDLAVITAEKERKQFVFSAVMEYKGSLAYKQAVDGINYSTGNNTAISEFRKLLYTITGEAVPDNFSANHKCASGFLNRLTCQLSSYLLSNGVQFEQDKTKDKLDTDLDTKLLNAAQNALIQGASYGFFNLDHIDYFSASEFVPLFDEETGALRAGIRFWQITSDKPMRATLYEEDGFTEYMKKDMELVTIMEKRAYILNTKHSNADGLQIVSGENYKGFPIVPLYANIARLSELAPVKSQIDAFDLIKSGFANDLDEASMMYWTLENCGGMTDIDLVKFRDRIRTVKAAVVDGDQGARAEAHTVDVPYQSREVYLNRLEKDIIKDFMGLDMESMRAGNVTATQIKAAYEPLSEKADRFEAQIIHHILALLELAGIEDYPKFRRSQMANELEQTQMVMMCANILDTQTILEHIPWITVDEVPAILERLQDEEMNRVVDDNGSNDNGNDDGDGDE